MEKKKQNQKNVVLFPFMAQGHLIPFLSLAQQIQQQKGYSITFINTPLNIKNLQKSLSSNPSISIKLVEIPFRSSDHGLPPDTENSDSLPYHLFHRFLVASSCLELSFRNLLSDLVQKDEKPVCVVSDIFFGWVADVAHEFGIFHAIFSATAGFGMACYYSVWMNLPHKDSDSDEFMLPDFPEAGELHVSQITPSVFSAGDDDPFTNFQRKNLPMWSKADAVIFNTVEEMDETGLTYFRRKLLGVSVFAVGPLLLSEKDRATASGQNSTARSCIEWLDSKRSRSVLYICFGSQNAISASQMMSLAGALDSSGKNFIWVLKPPLGFDDDVNTEFSAEKWLPEGFMQRVRDEDRGLIIEKWAPQMEILAHESTAAFLTHCGWNSVLEALRNGVPLLGWPIQAEQFYNSKFLVEEVGVCLELCRGTKRELSTEDFMEKIEMVMGENAKGERIRRRAFEVQEMIRNAVRDEEDEYKGSSVKNMDELFLAALLKDGRKD